MLAGLTRWAPHRHFTVLSASKVSDKAKFSLRYTPDIFNILLVHNVKDADYYIFSRSDSKCPLSYFDEEKLLAQRLLEKLKCPCQKSSNDFKEGWLREVGFSKNAVVIEYHIRSHTHVASQSCICLNEHVCGFGGPSNFSFNQQAASCMIM